MTVYKSAMSGVVETLIDALTASGAKGAIVIPESFRKHKITIRGNGAVGAGAVQIESASNIDYTGTWNPLGSGPITVVADSEIEFTFEGQFNAIQARISTTVTVGTVSVFYTGGR